MTRKRAAPPALSSRTSNHTSTSASCASGRPVRKCPSIYRKCKIEAGGDTQEKCSPSIPLSRVRANKNPRDSTGRKRTASKVLVVKNCTQNNTVVMNGKRRQQTTTDKPSIDEANGHDGHRLLSISGEITLMKEGITGMSALGDRTEEVHKLCDIHDAKSVTECTHTNEPKAVNMNHCPYCDFEYTCPRQLAPHVQLAHPKQLLSQASRFRYKCLYCEDCCSRPRNIRIHMHLQHPANFSTDALRRTKRIPCTVDGCTQAFHKATKLRQHLVEMHDQVACDRAKRRQTRYNAERLRARAAKVATGELASWGQGAVDTKKKPSTIKTRKHKSSRLRDCHEACWEAARQGLGFCCSYCDKVFVHHSLCVIHELSHEVKGSRTDEEVICQKCSRTFTSLAQLTIHQRDVHGADPKSNVCPTCGKTFTSPHYVKVHVQAVHERCAKFVCAQCGKTFFHKNGLLTHRQSQHSPPDSSPTVTKPKPPRYSCSICDARLSTYTGFKTHMDKHNGVQRYVCRHCGRRFTSMNHRTAHEKIHTGERSHRCPICYKAFTNQGTLYNHLYRYAVHGPLPRVRRYGSNSSLELLLQAAEACKQDGKGVGKDGRTVKKTTRRPASRTGSMQPVEIVTQSSCTIVDVPSETAAKESPNFTADLETTAIVQQSVEDKVGQDMEGLHLHTNKTPEDTLALQSCETHVTSAPSTDDGQITLVKNDTDLKEVVSLGTLAAEDSVNVSLVDNQQVAFIIVPETKEGTTDLASEEVMNIIQISVDEIDQVVRYVVPAETVTLETEPPNERC